MSWSGGSHCQRVRRSGWGERARGRRGSCCARDFRAADLLATTRLRCHRRGERLTSNCNSPQHHGQRPDRTVERASRKLGT
eukprot:2341129-Rhodomonas_salina.3